MRAICVSHNLEFPNEEAYKQHKKAMHVKPPQLPNGVTEEMLPTPEFMEQVERIENYKKPDTSSEGVEIVTVMVDTPKGPQPLSVPKTDFVSPMALSQLIPEKDPEPIVLEYRFKGDCKAHKTPVVTLTIEAENTRTEAIIAYCDTGRHQVDYKKVIPIDKQVIKEKKT